MHPNTVLNSAPAPTITGVSGPMGAARSGTADALPPGVLVRRESASKYVATFVVICAALSPSLFFTFGYHNDFNAWAYDTHACCMAHPETTVLFAVGRYFGAIAQNFQFLTIHSLQDFWVWRLIGILSAALLAVYYLHIVTFGRAVSWLDAFLAIAVFTLPTMQFQAVWVSMYMFWTPPILCGLVAARLLVAAVERPTVSGKIAIGVPAFLVLLVGTFFYPASATFVLVPVAHRLVTQSSRRVRLMAVAASVALGSAFIALFVIHKFIVLPNLANVPYLGDYEYKLSRDLVAAVPFRLGIYFREAAYFWLSLEVPWFPSMLRWIALGAVGYIVVRLVRRSLQPNALIDGIMAAGLFFVATAPLVVVGQFATTFRITFTMTAICLLVFFWLLRQLPLRATAVAAALAVLGCPLAFVSIYGVASAAQAEDETYVQALTGLAPNVFHPIVILRPNASRYFLNVNLRNDFGGLGAIQQIADLVIAPRFKVPATFDVTMFVLKPVEGAPPAIEKNSVIVDLSHSFRLPPFRTFAGRVGVVSATARGAAGPMYAIDGDPSTFWEACGQPFPIELELDLPAERVLTGYAMSTIEEPGRMPNDWEILVTTDGQNWRQVQHISSAGGWKPRDTRRYTIDPAPAAKAIKLRINGTDAGQCLRLYEFTPTFATDKPH